MLEATHNLLILMWLTGTTPNSWKQSNTILLHKKNDETLLENYGPTALANTLYKLWTGLIQKGLSKAEHFDILSSSQEGFREDKDTMQQLHNLLNVLSDAKTNEQNLYMLYVDFSSAFNTIDHDKLLMMLYSMGFTTNAVNVIADLYTKATTKIKFPSGLSDAIDINRGTIQGDTLSPLLFLISIEPLLRWLQSGGRGYKYGCLQQGQHADLTTSKLGYADDLVTMSSNPTWLQLQAQKVEAFTSWAGMKVNCKKCGTTGMLYEHARDGVIEDVLSPQHRNTENATRRNQDARTVCTIPPSPHSALHLSTSNWSFQLDKMLAEVRKRGEQLSHMHSLDFIKSVIVPAATYAFPLAYLTSTDLKKLDKIYSRICKRAMEVPGSTSTCMVFEDRSKIGGRMTSLQVDYTKVVAESLVESLLDPGQWGIVSRALTHLQHGILGDAMKDKHTDKQLHQVSHYHLTRKFAITQQAGLKLTVPDGTTKLKGNSSCEQITAALPIGASLQAHLQIPWSVYLPLLELGYESFTNLMVDMQTPTIIDTHELRLRHKHRANDRARIALKQTQHASKLLDHR